jgi:diguanylate cyclase (GGDEF)-like protein
VALLVANHFASAFSLASGAQDEELINISGRQRMLSQRILFLSERYVMTGDEADLARLSSAVQVFHSSHELLAEEAARDPDLAEYYDFGRSSGLDERARAYVFIATDITAGTATPAVSVMQVNTLVRMGRDSLLGELNAAVTGFETVANNRAGQLKLVQNVTLAMALFIILLEFLLIFRPLNRWVVQTVRRLDRDANFDALTGLENRRRFTEGLERQIAERPEACSVVVVALDLDGFKAVNDVLGHPAGDDVLRYVARLLQEETARLPTETPPLMSRLGGDEFFVSFIAQTSAAVSVTETFGATLIGRLKDPVPIALENGDERCIVGVSMGFVTLAAQGALIDTVLADADIALYSSKRAGKGRITRFQPEMREAAVSRLHRETELRRGLLDGEFEPFFQPQVDMATGRFAGFEALARWRHPVRGLLSPDKFLSDAEETNVMNAIEGGLIFKSLDFVAQMNAAGLAIPNMSINVSEHSLRDDGFVENLVGTCAMLGLAHRVPGQELRLQLHHVFGQRIGRHQLRRALADLETAAVHGGNAHRQTVEHLEGVEAGQTDPPGNIHPLLEAVEQAAGRVDIGVVIEEIDLRMP